MSMLLRHFFDARAVDVSAIKFTARLSSLKLGNKVTTNKLLWEPKLLLFHSMDNHIHEHLRKL